MKGVNYVYEIAFELENDLKYLSESLDKISICPLIHKIVNVLEELENHSQLYEVKRSEIDQLRQLHKKLEDEELSKEQERQIHENELEVLEKSWHSESMQLMKTLEKLQNENSHKKVLIEKATKKPRWDPNKKLSQQLEIKNVHLKLKETIDNEVEEIKLLKKEIAQRCIDFDAMQQQCLNLSNINAEICENHCNNKLISKRLIEEKVDIEAQIIINNKSIHNNNNDEVFYEESISIVNKNNNCRSKNNSDINFSWEEVKLFLQDCNRLKSEVNEKEEQLNIFRPIKSDNYDDDVQGPINKEPYDKMSPSFYHQSGIRKYFQRLMAGINK